LKKSYEAGTCRDRHKPGMKLPVKHLDRYRGSYTTSGGDIPGCFATQHALRLSTYFIYLAIVGHG
jgi:hypothetical protein